MPNPATAAQTGKRTRRSLPAQEIGARFVADVSGIPDVLAVGVTSFGNAFRIVTVIDAYDMDVCEQVFCRESKLYELAPDSRPSSWFSREIGRRRARYSRVTDKTFSGPESKRRPHGRESGAPCEGGPQ
jgi:hypothetical protein